MAVCDISGQGNPIQAQEAESVRRVRETILDLAASRGAIIAIIGAGQAGDGNAAGQFMTVG